MGCGQGPQVPKHLCDTLKNSTRTENESSTRPKFLAEVSVACWTRCVYLRRERWEGVCLSIGLELAAGALCTRLYVQGSPLPHIAYIPRIAQTRLIQLSASEHSCRKVPIQNRAQTRGCLKTNRGRVFYALKENVISSRYFPSGRRLGQASGRSRGHGVVGSGNPYPQ